MSLLVDKSDLKKHSRILKGHGPTLRNFVCQFGTKARTKVNQQGHAYHQHLDLNGLVDISLNCQELTALGLNLGWEAVKDSDRFHGIVRIHRTVSRRLALTNR